MLPAVERSARSRLVSRWTDSIVREWCADSWTGNDRTPSADLPYDTMSAIRRRFVGT
jgi:hypothetical protein